MGFYENYPHLEVFLIQAAASVHTNIPVIQSRKKDEAEGRCEGAVGEEAVSAACLWKESGIIF